MPVLAEMIEESVSSCTNQLVTLLARNRRKKASRTRSWIVCALLAASLWRAPVPWIHSHETLEAQGLPEAALAWHVHHLHAQEGEHSIFGWHLHLSYPWEVSNEPSPPSEPDAPKPRNVYDMPYVVSAAPSSVDVDRHANQCVLSLPIVWSFADACVPADAGRIWNRHFPPTHPPSVTLRALICVVQC
jgi:hypothetical protein